MPTCVPPLMIPCLYSSMGHPVSSPACLCTLHPFFKIINTLFYAKLLFVTAIFLKTLLLYDIDITNMQATSRVALTEKSRIKRVQDIVTTR